MRRRVQSGGATGVPPASRSGVSHGQPVAGKSEWWGCGDDPRGPVVLRGHREHHPGDRRSGPDPVVGSGSAEGRDRVSDRGRWAPRTRISTPALRSWARDNRPERNDLRASRIPSELLTQTEGFARSVRTFRTSIYTVGSDGEWAASDESPFEHPRHGHRRLRVHHGLVVELAP